MVHINSTHIEKIDKAVESNNQLSLVVRKADIGVSNQVRPGPTQTGLYSYIEDGWRLEISDLGGRRIALSMKRKQRH